MSSHAYSFPLRFSRVLTPVCPIRLLPYLGHDLKTEKHDILFIEKLKFHLTGSILID